MSQIRSGGYGHQIYDLGYGRYRLQWFYDVRVARTRLRSSRPLERDTDAAGARRIAAKWRCALPLSAR